MRVAKVVTLTGEERTALLKWSRGRSTPARLVQRAKIVLAAAEGKRNEEIAADLGCTRRTVGTWRNRFASNRLPGIEKDAPRGGRKPTRRAAVATEIVRKTTQEKPANATHWSTRSLAKAMKISDSMVRRVWRDSGLKPHLVKTFKISNDPRFVEKLFDVVGLYLNPPEHALVISCDEKSQIQALDRTQKSLPMFHMHFTPTSSSWLNLIERWFRDITERRIRRGVFKSVAQLEQAIDEYIKRHNAHPQGFVWTAKADAILEKVRRARAALDNVPSGGRTTLA